MKKFYKSLFILFCILFTYSISFSQGVRISTTAGDPHESAILDIESTTQGMLIPRLPRGNISNPAEGLLIYDTTDDAFFLRGNGAWINLSSSAEIWSQSGSSVYLTNLTSSIGIGTTSPTSKLVVQADSDAGVDDPLFQIKDKTGKTIMSVTSAGVRIYLDENNMAMASSGGFAVGQYPSLKSDNDDFFKVTPFQTSVTTLPPGNDKGKAGGFAVGQYPSLKGGIPDYNFYTNAQETRIYTGGDKDPQTKEGDKAVSGGFAVGQYGSLKASDNNYMYMVPDNYFIGHQAGDSLQYSTYTGKYNTFLGYQSGIVDTSGSNNVFVGHKTGYSNTVGTNNVFVGNEAGVSNISGAENVFIGTNTGRSNTDGSFNSLYGYMAGSDATLNNQNVFLGSFCGNDADNAMLSVMIGSSCGSSAYDSNVSIMIGDDCGRNANNSGANIMIGYKTGMGADNAQHNVMIGPECGINADNCSNSVMIGSECGKNNHGDKNTFIGRGSGSSNTIASENTAIGAHSLGSNTTGRHNTAVGRSALGAQSYDNGGTEWQSNNTAIGCYALANNQPISTSTGINNTAIGNGSLGSNTTGYNNTAAGNSSLSENTTGFNNTTLGNRAGFMNNTGNGNVFVGFEAGFSETGSNKLYIENSSAGNTDALIYGEFDNDLLRINGTLNINNAYDMPTDNGDNGQVLVTNGTDAASWTSASALYDNDWTISGSDMYSSVSGNVGIGTNTPQCKLDVRGANTDDGGLISLSNSDQSHRLLFFSGRQNDPYPFIQWKDGDDFRFATDQSGWSEKMRIESGGNVGIGTSTPGAKLDVRNSDTEDILNLYDGATEIFTVVDGGNVGVGTNTPGAKLDVRNSSTEDILNLYDGATEIFTVVDGGDVGIGTTNPSYRLHVEDDFVAIYGNVTTTGSFGYGVRGSSYGATANSYGIYGDANNSASYNYGVYGYAASSGSNRNFGVYGHAGGSTLINYGVYTKASGTDNYAIYARATSTTDNYAGYFYGNLHVTGTNTKAADAIKIDHPKDPENMYLYMPTVTSSEMLNIYNGNVILDKNGEATVTMPEWFDAVNIHFRYQLTAIGAPGPNLYISKKMEGNKFSIAGGTPDMEVSWMISGTRNDPFARKHKIVTEKEKSSSEKGTYIHPELYGQAIEKSVDYKNMQQIKKTINE